MSISHLTWYLMRIGGTEQIFTESDPEVPPSPSVPGSKFLSDFDPREPHPCCRGLMWPLASCTSRDELGAGPFRDPQQ